MTIKVKLELKQAPKGVNPCKVCVLKPYAPLKCNIVNPQMDCEQLDYGYWELVPEVVKDSELLSKLRQNNQTIAKATKKVEDLKDRLK